MCTIHKVHIVWYIMLYIGPTLKRSELCGNDGLSAERFKHADGCVSILLSIF